MAIFITGDTHADFERFKKDIFYEQSELTKNDYVIICGDFGGVWDGSPRERYWLDWLEAKPFTTLFVSGNHENYDLLAEFPVQKWHGGRVQFIRPSIVHLMRGQIYEIEGKRFLTMGGASSHDIANLGQCGWAVDYIITHCCPTSIQEELGAGFYQADALTNFLEEIAQRCQFKYWFFGHYHDN